MAATTLAVIGAAAAVKGAVDANKNAKAANAAASEAANRPAPTVDINALDAQAREFAQKNAADSAALEAQYNPGAAQLRANSLAAVNAGLGRSAQTQTLADQVAAQAGQVPTGASYDSPLLRNAIAQAQSQLALGGTLDRETQNAATRGALAKSGTVSGGLNLGRDLTARDLGLTSLQLQQQRLTNASNIGAQEAALGQGNANLSLQAQQAGTNNLFNSANFLASLDSGDFARQLSAAQLGQNIAQPASGLDPRSVVNLAVGNSNATASQQQQASALKVAAANQAALLGGQLAGAGLGVASRYFTPTNTTPAPTYAAPPASSVPYYGYGFN